MDNLDTDKTLDSDMRSSCVKHLVFDTDKKLENDSSLRDIKNIMDGTDLKFSLVFEASRETLYIIQITEAFSINVMKIVVKIIKGNINIHYNFGLSNQN